MPICLNPEDAEQSHAFIPLDQSMHPDAHLTVALANTADSMPVSNCLGLGVSSARFLIVSPARIC